MAIRRSRERHISPCSIASDSRAVEMHSCRCIETWHVDTGARADVGPTLQGGTACVVSNAKFAASVDPSPQTSFPEAVDAGQSSASKARYKSGGDVRRHWSLSRTSRSGTLHAWVPRACAGCGVRMRDVMRPTPRVQRAFVLPSKWHLKLCQSWLLGKSTVEAGSRMPSRHVAQAGACRLPLRILLFRSSRETAAT